MTVRRTKATGVIERLRERKRERVARARARRKRLAKTGGMIVVALLALLAFRCSCAPMAPSVPPEATPRVTPTPTPTPTARVRQGSRRPPRGPGLGPVSRPAFLPGQDAQEPWFEEFRAQAAARSRDAAACFPGVERGAVRWSADLLGRDGRATRNAFAPLVGLPELTPEQTECLEASLASRAYTLRDFSRESARVTLVIEF